MQSQDEEGGEDGHHQIRPRKGLQLSRKLSLPGVDGICKVLRGNCQPNCDIIELIRGKVGSPLEVALYFRVYYAQVCGYPWGQSPILKANACIVSLKGNSKNSLVVTAGVAKEIVFLFFVEERGVISSWDELVLADHLEGGKNVLEPAEVESWKGGIGVAEFFVEEGVGCERVSREVPEEMVTSLLEYFDIL